jgi:hypothetical protein|tara:strand:- start:731 stop:847 length:117 start_codon:yes stop_codon:yes gene_type:complete
VKNLIWTREEALTVLKEEVKLRKADEYLDQTKGFIENN